MLGSGGGREQRAEVTGVGGGRHCAGGGGAVRSRPAGAQSRRRLIEGAPCGEECWGEKED